SHLPSLRGAVATKQSRSVREFFVRHGIATAPRLRLAMTLLIAPCLASHTFAHPAPDYPAKRVRVIVGQAPGGGTDIQTRLFAQKLTEAFGRPVIVENRTGLGSVLSYRT